MITFYQLKISIILGTYELGKQVGLNCWHQINFFFFLRLHYLLLITRKPLQKPASQQWLLFFQLLVAQGEPIEKPFTPRDIKHFLKETKYTPKISQIFTTKKLQITRVMVTKAANICTIFTEYKNFTMAIKQSQYLKCILNICLMVLTLQKWPQNISDSMIEQIFCQQQNMKTKSLGNKATLFFHQIKS